MRIITTSYLKPFAGIVLLAGIAFISLQKDNAADENPVDQKTPIAKTVAPVKTPKPVKAEPAVASLKKSQDERPADDPFEGKELKYRLQQVAAQFSEDIKYPVFSKPIRNDNELIKYLPNRSVSSSMAINIDDPGAAPLEDSPQVSLQASKFRYYNGEPVLADAEITGLKTSSYVGLSAYAMADKEVVARASEVTESARERGQEDHHYRIRFDDLSHFASGYKGDLRIVAELTVDGRAYAVSSQVRYPDTVATLERVGRAEVRAEYLQIPVYIYTTEPGLHAISANLYDAESGQPLVHLRGSEQLKSESGVIQLKAHIVALKKMGHEGPYELKDISLIRGPSPPRNVTDRGLVTVASYSIAGFPFSEYEDVPYVDERAQARLDFLTQLGRID